MSNEWLDTPTDIRLPGLSLLFDMPRVTEILMQNLIDSKLDILACEGKYLRYKPSTNCIVAYSAKCAGNKGEEPFDLMFYGKCYSSEDFPVATEKAKTHQWEKTQGFNPVIVLPDDNVIFYVFPNDCEMKELVTVTDARKIARMLYEINGFLPRKEWRISDKRLCLDVIRYKPEKRAVVRISSRAKSRSDQTKKPFTVYLRTYSDDRGRSVFHRMQDLNQALKSHPEVIAPHALFYIEDKRYLFTEGLDGRPFIELLSEADKFDFTAKAARALAALHQLNNVELLTRSSEDLMSDAKATAETLQLILPEMSVVVKHILNRLQQLFSSSGSTQTGFVHGDFHSGQLLIQENATVVLDFDRSFRGEALLDVGNFYADLTIQGRHHRWKDTQAQIDSFVNSYVKSVGHSIDRERLKLWIGYGLFMFAVYPFRSMNPSWKTSVAATLAESERILS